MQIAKMKDFLDYLDYAKEREKESGPVTCNLTSEQIVKRGIADLDFDPYFFSVTGQTSPEGFAVTKGTK